jgi:hypothetical protein
MIQTSIADSSDSSKFGHLLTFHTTSMLGADPMPKSLEKMAQVLACSSIMI